MSAGRQWGRIALTIVFTLFSLNALGQVGVTLIGRSSDPVALLVLQMLVGVAGATSAIGTWRLSPWAPIAALVYGVATSAMLAALPTLLSLEPEARGGIYVGAVSVLGFGLGTAWYLRRALRRSSHQPAQSG